ncbi:hypothetical protein SESBI_22182 [Sesbania bispinosa]|nr:hypothetical protein SESBI_22182 [Sesbania bispinosa]
MISATTWTHMEAPSSSLCHQAQEEAPEDRVPATTMRLCSARIGCSHVLGCPTSVAPSYSALLLTSVASHPHRLPTSVALSTSISSFTPHLGG